MQIHSWVLCAAAVLLLQGQSPVTPGPALSADDIVLLLKNGVAEERVQQMIAVRGIGFTLSQAVASVLRNVGIHQPLLDSIRASEHRMPDASGFIPARVVHTVTPVYPPLALQVGVSGKVSVRITVGPDGIPRDIELLNSIGYGLDASALAAVRQWRFEPALKDGKPAQDSADAVLTFRPPWTQEQLKEIWTPGFIAFSQTLGAGAPLLLAGSPVTGLPDIANASVKLEFTLNTSGAVSGVRVMHAPNRDAAEKIAQAFISWKFRPAMKNGVAAEARGRLRFRKGYGDPDADKPLYEASELMNAERPDFETPAFLRFLDKEFEGRHERGLGFGEISKLFGEWSLQTYGGQAELKVGAATRQFDALAALHPSSEDKDLVTRKDIRNRLKLDEELGTFATSHDCAPRATRTVSPKWNFQVDAHERPEALPYLNAAIKRLLADPEGRLLLENVVNKPVRILVVAGDHPGEAYSGIYSSSPTPLITLYRSALGAIRPGDEDLNQWRLLRVLTHEMVHAVYSSHTMTDEAMAGLISYRIADRIPRFFAFQHSAKEEIDRQLIGHADLSVGSDIRKQLEKFGIDAPPPDSEFRDPVPGPPVLVSESEESFDLDPGSGKVPPVNYVGKPAPSIALKTAEGGIFRLEDLRGKVVVIDFWASWCGPCRSQMPAMAKLHSEAAARGFTIVGIDDDTTPEAATAYLSENHYRWMNLHDREGAARRPFGVTGIPTTVVIDKEGIVRGYFRGAGSDFAHEIRNSLELAGIAATDRRK